MKARSASALVATVLLSLACAQAGAAPAAFAVRNGDILYSKQLDKGTTRPSDLYASWFAGGPARRLTRTPKFEPRAIPSRRPTAG